MCSTLFVFAGFRVSSRFAYVRPVPIRLQRRGPARDPTVVRRAFGVPVPEEVRCADPSYGRSWPVPSPP
ncbi:hypothetical protein GCM10010112_48460 [Actinoplanes lobatus]|uniref:Secreted protein n=1 Tax=Actinoplanes lobatus TaxID=113568 RepID=A0ABQ4AC16_9ACTN|nr:hypothetical protein GCM10010112_48460 [Actinoplanes lobatus]GIE38537.1 hypothetical protein Alo02nite_14350 [Actinoplanes lobatus]